MKTSASTQFRLQELRHDPAKDEDGKGRLQATVFEVVFVSDLGWRFDQRRNFIDDIERAAPEFYETVGQHLKAWQAPASKISEGREQPKNFTPFTISETAEASSMQG